MAWEDRDYYRDTPRGSDRGLGRILGWLAYGRVHLYTAFDIRVAVHSTLIVFTALELLLHWGGGYGWQDKLVYLGLLWVMVLLHEYGHCFGARAVGGSAHHILLWPLGGLAFTDPPRRPGPSFVTVAAGPAVNLVVCLLCLGALALLMPRGGELSFGRLLNPFSFILPAGVPLSYANVTFWLWYAFKVSWLLFVFNMALPIFPLDCGRLVQIALWPRVGYYKSMVFATLTGQVGCVALGLVGLFTFNLLLIVMGIFFFIENRRQYRMLKAEGPWAFGDEDEPDWMRSATMDPDEPAKIGFFERRRRDKAARDAENAAVETARSERQVDEVLAKVGKSGMASLTAAERRVLERATAARRGR